MKRGIIAFALVVIPMLAQAADYEITVERKKTGIGQAKGNVELKTSQSWTGEVKIQSHVFKPVPELEARYIIFVKRQRLGQNRGEDKIDKVKGSSKVADLKSGMTTTFLTSEVTLKQEFLAPGWIMVSGANRAEDSVLGVWVKLFDGTKQVAEYVNPSTLTTKYKWE